MSKYPDHRAAFEELMVVARTNPKLRAVVVAPRPEHARNLFEEFGAQFSAEVTVFTPQRRATVEAPNGRILSKPGAAIFFKSADRANAFAGAQYGYVLKVFPAELLTLLNNIVDLELGLRLDPTITVTAVL